METLPNDWFALAALVFVLGMKHGFDADHLATIDGLTRYNARHNPKLARLCGALFSLGHGTIVVLIALTVSTVAWACSRAASARPCCTPLLARSEPSVAIRICRYMPHLVVMGCGHYTPAVLRAP